MNDVDPEVAEDVTVETLLRSWRTEPQVDDEPEELDGRPEWLAAE